jgi:uncharacterized protein
LVGRVPRFAPERDPYLHKKLRLKDVGTSLALTLFLGGGIFFLCAWGAIPFALIFAALAYYVWSDRKSHLKRYASPEAYAAFVADERAKNAAMLRQGYMKEVSPGYYDFTDAYYQSAEYQSSSDDSSSSSSGGGSSGGGGASSSW